MEYVLFSFTFLVTVLYKKCKQKPLGHREVALTCLDIYICNHSRETSRTETPFPDREI
jgi:hypothetical protein